MAKRNATKVPSSFGSAAAAFRFTVQTGEAAPKKKFGGKIIVTEGAVKYTHTTAARPAGNDDEDWIAAAARGTETNAQTGDKDNGRQYHGGMLSGAAAVSVTKTYLALTGSDIEPAAAEERMAETVAANGQG
jgi:hypothetical protein